MTTAASKYAAGQRVEVLRPDFTRPGFPETWQAGIVDTAEWLEDYRVWDVKVRTDGGRWSTQRVGPRGGNRRIRTADRAATTHTENRCEHCNDASGRAAYEFGTGVLCSRCLDEALAQDR